MAMYEWSEVFMSIEGEGPYSGNPTVYIRFARCNFQCKLFNNPNKEIESDGYATLGFDPKDYKTIQEIPLITKGCDSQYSINPKFAHMWHKGDEKALAAEVLKVLPHNSFVNPVSGKRVILSLTGGEPTIRLKFWIPILEELYAYGMRDVLIETNCAAPLRDKDLEELYRWVNEHTVKLIWSNSPKLSSSGELWVKAIRPEIATKQRYCRRDNVSEIKAEMIQIYGHEQYFKFVCGPTEEDFNEVAKAMNEYYEAGIPRDADVYIMCQACTEEQQQQISAQVANMCIQKGYIYCHRIQNDVYGNGPGT